MRLTTYIKDLLYRYECVIVPGFGAFLTKQESARIDTRSHTFYPPSKSVSFNRQLQTNDGLLANYVASVENCNYELALQRVRNFTAEISLKLSEGKTISFGTIGEIAMNAERQLIFTPSEKENFNTSAFGLSSFVSANIERTAVSTSEEKQLKTAVEHPSTTRTTLLKYAAIGLLAITIGGLSGLKIYEGQVEQHNFVEKQKADKRIENQIQEATFVFENPLPAVSYTVEKRMGKYHVIAGAFRIRDNADKKIRQLHAAGYNARLIGVNKYGLHQVAYQSYEDRLEALKSLRQIQQSVNKDAWLLVQDLAK